MSTRTPSLTYAVGTLAIGAVLVFPGHRAALADDSNDSSLQPNLKSWSKTIPTAKRFVVLADFNSQAVLDRETGMVWEQSPASTTLTWSTARSNCADKVVGGRKGWRLPSFAELATLVDPTVTPGPILPTGHPFTNVQSTYYWSTTTGAEFPVGAWAVTFDFATTGSVEPVGKTAFLPAWCVRGPMNADEY